MIVLDENIDEPQRKRLEGWRVHVRQVGVEVGQLGMKDRDEIIPLLHSLRRPTFFTRDHDFYDRNLTHPDYCLVYLEVTAAETANFIRRFLRHSTFRSQSQRLGKVVRVHRSAINFWQVGQSTSAKAAW
ncbi:MAG TPA: hypothetical protein VJH03_16595 [Blastocatellia bacterium]|nr:hypothetical protein [Blastocatellia bacterium]